MAEKKDLSRRVFLTSGTAIGASAILGCSGSKASETAAAATTPASTPAPTTKTREAKGRVVILGFDGVEPTILQDMIERGEAPNFAKLQQQGSFKKLQSTIPPQSPVAWTSFTTCKNPGGHNIYDFVKREPDGPRGPMPSVGTGKLINPKLGSDGGLTQPAEAIAYRKGESFWKVADQQGVKSKVFNVPFVFPPDELDNGTMLCGLGVTDLRGTTSTYTLLSDSFSQSQVDTRLAGGQRQKLNFDGSDTTVIQVQGPRDQRYKLRDPKGYTTAPVKIVVDRAGGAGMVEIAGTKTELKTGQWSEWCEIKFEMSPQFSAYAVSRFYPLEIGQEVRIYMACTQFHPKHPYVPFTEPSDFAEELHDRFGLFKTIGWAFDTHALRQDSLTEDAFLDDVEYTMNWRERLTLEEIDRGEFDLLISAWTATDRVGHMFWRYRDEKHPMHDPSGVAKYGTVIEDSYKKCDSIVGKVLAKLNEDDLLMVLSDHGFETWRTGFGINDWLEEQGYLTIKDRQQAERGYLMGIDWTKTKAYAIGLSSMYLNIRGRETGGIVDPGEAENLMKEIKEKLLQVKDPETGLAVFSNIYTREVFTGEAAAAAPDFSLGYARSYQGSKTAAKGAVGTGLFEKNDNKWSGEHAAADVAWCPGILFTNRKVESDFPDIRDLGVTALNYLGCDVPTDFEGEQLV